MKKVIFIILLLFLSSCTRKDRNQIFITEFNERIIDTLVPYNKSYTSYSIQIKGYANDSIRIGLGSNSNSFYFTGKIDQRLNFDYYGQFERLFLFDPFKATEGELEIKYGLY